jgi:hypothetical protein
MTSVKFDAMISRLATRRVHRQISTMLVGALLGIGAATPLRVQGQHTCSNPAFGTWSCWDFQRCTPDGGCQNCGSAATACGFTCCAASKGQVCLDSANGLCGCPPNTRQCGGVCDNLDFSVQNCGACGKACAAPPHATAVCSKGVCGFMCDSGYTKCGDKCVDVRSQTETNNCGSCFNECDDPPPGAVELCFAASKPGCDGDSCCGFRCGPGLSICRDSSGSSSCVALSTDSENCGSCGNACDGSELHQWYVHPSPGLSCGFGSRRVRPVPALRTRFIRCGW